MTVENGKALVQRFNDEVWGKGNLDVVYEIFASDYIRHDLRPGNPLPGPDGQRKIAADFRAAFPDLQTAIDFMIEEGEFVVSRWAAEGTHTGIWNDIAPTGKRIRFCGVNIYRIRNGKVIELWNHRDDLGVMQQLGVPIFAGSR